jgi:hypothetical protein
MMEWCQYSLKNNDDLLVPPFKSGGGPNVIITPIPRLKELDDLATEYTIVESPISVPPAPSGC